MIIRKLSNSKGVLIPVLYRFYEINGDVYLAINKDDKKCASCDLCIEKCLNIMCWVNNVIFIKQV